MKKTLVWSILLFVVFSHMSQANQKEGMDQHFQYLLKAKSMGVLNEHYQPFSDNLDVTSQEQLTLALIYGEKLYRFGENNTAQKHFNSLFASIRKQLGNKSFHYLYTSIYELSLDSEPDFKRFMTKQKRLWSKIDDFSDDVDSAEEVVQLKDLLAKLSKKPLQTVSKRQLKNIVESLAENANKWLPQNSLQKLEVDTIAANLLLLGSYNKQSKAIAESIGQRIDNIELPNSATIRILKDLTFLFDKVDLPDLADQQLIKLAQFYHPENDAVFKSLLRVDPRYPSDAAKKGAQGSVTLNYDINEFGRTENIKVVSVEGHKSFAISAENALKKWRYLPQKEGGEFVSVKNKTVALDFSLQQ